MGEGARGGITGFPFSLGPPMPFRNMRPTTMPTQTLTAMMRDRITAKNQNFLRLESGGVVYTERVWAV